MTLYSIQDVQTQVHTLVYRGGTVEGQRFYEDMAFWFHVGLPFLQKWADIPSNFQENYQQALRDMQQPEFVATWSWLTVWGTRPGGLIPS